MSWWSKLFRGDQDVTLTRGSGEAAPLCDRSVATTPPLRESDPREFARVEVDATLRGRHVNSDVIRLWRSELADLRIHIAGALIAALSDKSPNVRLGAVRGLMSGAADAKAELKELGAVEALSQLVGDQDHNLGVMASRAIGEISLRRYGADWLTGAHTIEIRLIPAWWLALQGFKRHGCADDVPYQDRIPSTPKADDVVAYCGSCWYRISGREIELLAAEEILGRNLVADDSPETNLLVMHKTCPNCGSTRVRPKFVPLFEQPRIPHEMILGQIDPSKSPPKCLVASLKNLAESMTRCEVVRLHPKDRGRIFEAIRQHAKTDRFVVIDVAGDCPPGWVQQFDTVFREFDRAMCVVCPGVYSCRSANSSESKLLSPDLLRNLLCDPNVAVLIGCYEPTPPPFSQSQNTTFALLLSSDTTLDQLYWASLWVPNQQLCSSNACHLILLDPSRDQNKVKLTVREVLQTLAPNWLIDLVNESRC